MTMRCSKYFLWVLAFLVFLATNSHAQRWEPDAPFYPRDLDQVDVYLGTKNIGFPIYSKYGHTIVRILDRSNVTDIGYNWGTFDFDDPAFIPNFLRGYLIYYMSFGPWRHEVAMSKLERQTMWMEHVNLTKTQKKRLIDRIFWQARPENIHYPYFFFYDNCSTRVRDLFDLAVEGQIKARSAIRMSGATYRDRVMEHNQSAPFFAMGQDIILNSEPDKQMSEWDDMFIPGRLREYLLKMPAFDDSGREIEGVTFLSDTKTLTQHEPPKASVINGYMIVWILSGAPAFCGLMMVTRTRQKAAGFRLIGLSNVILGTLWGGVGVFLTASWAYGSHTVLPHNANLWMIWPVDLLYVATGLSMLLKGIPLNQNGRFAKMMRVVTIAHLAGICVLLLLTLSHALEQNTERVVYWLAPLTALCWISSTLRPGNLRQD